jgi:hypothetical protein
MKPSTELFKLIKSLSKSEKRFFKLSSTLQSGDKNYLRLFDYIDAKDEYNEDLLKKYFKNERFIKHLPSEKNHLYRLILKSLRSFYAEQSVSSILKQEIKNIEILYTKALYKECEKFVVRAKELAKDYERFYFWFELISWEKKLLEQAYEAGEFSRSPDAIVEEEEHVLQLLRNLADYQIIYSRINLIFRSGGFSRTESERAAVDEIANHPLIKGKNTALSTRASSMCYYIKGLCAATKQHFDESFGFFARTREILDKNPLIRSDSGQRYVMTICYLLRCFIEKEQFIEAEKLLIDLRQLSSQKGFNSTDIQVRIFTSSTNLEFLLLQKTGKFNGCVDMISNIENLQADFGEKISKEQEILLTYHKAYSYFGVGEFRKALAYLNIVLNDNEQRLRKDVYSYARIFNLIIHYELGNDDYMEYLLKSTKRYLQRHDRAFEVEKICIEYIKKLPKATGSSDRLMLLERMKESLDELFQHAQHRAILEYFNVPAWIISKIYKITFGEAVLNQRQVADF